MSNSRARAAEAGQEITKLAKVILIGGPPLAGKTTLARKLAARRGYCCMSTDDATQAVRAVTTPKSHPGFHISAGQDYREYCINQPVDQLIANALRQHEATWPAIKELIRVHAMWSSPAIIEGWALAPQRVAKLKIPNVQSLWMVSEEAVLAHRIRQAKDFLQGVSDKETLIKHFLARAISLSNHIKETAGRLGMPILEAAPAATPDELADQALNLLTNP